MAVSWIELPSKTLAVPVLVVSYASAIGGLALACLCAAAARSQHRPAVQFVTLVLSQLGLADFVFSASFAVAWWHNATPTGGAACTAAAFLNQLGIVVSAWWTILVAWAVRNALHDRTDALCCEIKCCASSTRFARVAACTWGVPLACVLLLTIKKTDRVLGSETSLPWCHWRRGASWSVMTVLLYGNVALALLYCSVTYVRIIRDHRQLRSMACGMQNELLAAAAPAAPAPAETETSVQRGWAIDTRLASYLAAYVLSQFCSLFNRLWQLARGDAPTWLLFAQAATQPAQGLLNALVYLHHSRQWWWTCRKTCCVEPSVE
jgi:hypothetical protein